MKGNILIVGYPESKLKIERSKIPAESGFNVYWFNWFSGNPKRLKEADWLTGIITPPPFGRLRILKSFILYWTFFKLRPCILHVHYALSTWPYAKWMGRCHPLIVSVMGGDIMPAQGFHDEKMEPTRHLLDKADIITSKSKFMDRRLQEIGPYKNKIRRVTWGMDSNTYRPGIDTSALREKLKISDDKVVFFCARSCEPRTNKETVIAAFAQVFSQMNSPAILLVSEYQGSVQYRDRIRQLASDLGINKNIRFLGEITSEEMPFYYNLADATISVPSSDGMPQTIYQAMSCGSFPIISDIPETKELVEIGCELAETKVQDAQEVAAAMVWVAENKTIAREKGLRNRPRILAIADKQIQDKAMVTIYEELMPKTLLRKGRS